MQAQQQQKAAFIDRDGTIIKEVGYLSSRDQIEWIEKTLDLCRLLQQKGYLLILITNQSGIARGYFSEKSVIEIHEYLFDQMRCKDIHFHGAYFCPHHPEGGVVAYRSACLCRKPAPGMLLQAARDHGIHLPSSVLVGDSFIDQEAGRAAGCRSFKIQELLMLSDVDWALIF